MSTSTTGHREVAHRIFAAEFEDATHAFRAGDDDRAPNYVVSPSGALINRVFVVGALTAVEQVNDETVRARIADPTGVFVVYASQYQPDARAALQELSTPAFVAVTGKANTFVPDGSDRGFTSIRPEAIAAVDADTRDHWTVTTAEHTLSRLGQLATGIQTGNGPHGGVDLALQEYNLTPGYVGALHECCIDTLEMIAGERQSVDASRVDLMDAPTEATIPLDDIIDIGEEFGLAPVPSVAPDTDAESSTSSPDASQTTDPDPTPPPDTGTAEPDAIVDTEPEVDADAEIDPDEPVVSADEREAIESEYGTDFSTGSEIDPPTESDSSEPTDDADAPEPTSSTETQDTPEETEELSDNVMAVLQELDDGEGVPREAIVDTALDRFDAQESDVMDALRSAMMDGRCYEPAEDMLRPI